MNLSMQQNWAEQPAGMRDVYPHQARYRRQMENKLLSFFEENGYDMVSSGSVEYVNTLLRGRDASEAEDWIRFVDPNGRMVALRPDMTPSIARMAAPLLASGTKQIRWCYSEKVYRRSLDPVSLSWVGGKAAESTQVGVEWIGASGHSVDANILRLCQQSVQALGLRDWQLVLSHAGFTASILELLGFSQNTQQELLECLVQGDYVGFRQIHERNGVAYDLQAMLAQVNPLQPDTVPASWRSLWEASDAGNKARQIWDELVSFGRVVLEAGLQQNLAFDLTLTRDLSYYTGIIFEVFVPGVGAPIALGGRYDSLIAQFGQEAPAIGFTFEMERLLTSLTEGQWLSESTALEAKS